jgi:hypothetical protein
MRERLAAIISSVFYAAVIALFILLLQETKMITSANAYWYWILLVVLFLLATSILAWGFYPSFRKREDKNANAEITQGKALPKVQPKIQIRQILLQPETKRILAEAQTAARELIAPNTNVDYPVSMISNAKNKYTAVINKLENVKDGSYRDRHMIPPFITSLLTGVSLLDSYEKTKKRDPALNQNSTEIIDWISVINNSML